MNRIGLVVLLFTVAAIGAACDQSNTGKSSANNTGLSNANANLAQMDHSNMDHSTMDHSTMDHSNMKSSPNAATAPHDLQFIDTMIVHHQGAVDMARMVVERTPNPQLRKFAEDVEREQEREIAQMRKWREEWFAGQPPAINMEMPGMKESMDMDMSRLTAAKDKEFDVMFAEMMIPHHEGAVTMSQELLERTDRAELKMLADQIIKSQTAEIKQMEIWRTAWAS